MFLGLELHQFSCKPTHSLYYRYSCIRKQEREVQKRKTWVTFWWKKLCFNIQYACCHLLLLEIYCENMYLNIKKYWNPIFWDSRQSVVIHSAGFISKPGDLQHRFVMWIVHWFVHDGWLIGSQRFIQTYFRVLIINKIDQILFANKV